MATDTETRALAPFKDVLDVLAPYSADQYHRLVPTAMQQRSPLYAPAVQVVKVNPDDKREVYPTPGARDGTLCLHSQALARIANAIGIDFGQTRFEQYEQFWVTAHVPFEVVDALGQRRHGSASKTLDLRDGSIRAKLLGTAVSTARQFIREQAESGARSRVVKAWTGMPTSFTADELRKPFVALRWTLDVNQPDVRRALIDAGTRSANEVFGREGARVEIGPGDDDGEVAEGTFTEAPAADPEPDIPDAPAPATDVSAIAAAYTARAKTRPDNTQRAGNDLLGTLALAIANVYGLPNKSKEDKQAISDARKGVASVLFGKSVSDLSVGQATVVIEATKELAGQADLAAVGEVIGVHQRTLADAARAL